ncbi:hypothetical protein [Dyadobacter pollutisoli]|jgi:hypothetical protein|uniref:Uncharacterized protein n=1 Tax=Dyadobacter pollutisoli TaxID=2910158 RepID=A0A9E8NCH1_9BACT|nr:hypothetical protein [Dyadobacter pollutisoli]WAC12778.1 hypothetical protein ON006_02200 [Dyadobacter pollutisoli]
MPSIIEKTGKGSKKVASVQTDKMEHSSYLQQKLERMRSILEASPVPAELLKSKPNQI